MKFAFWGVFAVLALVWTGGAALMAQAVEWTALGIASQAPGAVGAEAASAVAATASLPVWLSGWVDADAWGAAVQMATDALTGVKAMLPAIGEAVSWLEPVVWMAWGLGLALLIVLALVGHWGLSRFMQRAPNVVRLG